LTEPLFPVELDEVDAPYPVTEPEFSATQENVIAATTANSNGTHPP
jgi:hypothetical protein